MTCQSIARPTRNNSHSRRAMYKGTPHLIDSTITTDSHNDIYPCAYSICSQHLCMPCILSTHNAIIIFTAINIVANKSNNV